MRGVECLVLLEAEFQAFVRRNLPRNFSAHLIHGLLGQTGFRLINAPTFVPAYITLLSGSELMVGVVRGIQALGRCLTPVAGATLIEHRRRVLPLAILVGAALRLQVLFFALAGMFLAGDLRLAAICGFLGLFGCFNGMQGVIFNSLRSKVIPVEVRGRLAGLRNFFAGLSAAGVGYYGGKYLVGTDAFGNGYAVTFLLAFALTSLGLCALLLMREPESLHVRERTGLSSRLSELPAMLRADRDFTAFFSARAFGTLGRMAVPFCWGYASTQMELGGSELGQLTAAFTLSQTASGLLWGPIADRTGFRATFLGALCVWILALLLLMSSTGFAALVLVFIAIGVGMSGFNMSSQNLVLEFGSPRNLPMRIAVSNTAADLTGAIGFFAGGVLVEFTSHLVLFWTAIGFKSLALLVMLFLVREPRHQGSLPA